MVDDEFQGVKALLSQVKRKSELPPPEEREALRVAADLSRAEVARAVGVGRQTVANWEQPKPLGTDPRPPARDRYLKLLEGLRALQADAAPAAAPATPQAPTEAPASGGSARSGEQPSAPVDAPEGMAPAEPCVRCGQPTPYRSRSGKPQHLGNFCASATSSAPAPASERRQPLAAPRPAAGRAVPEVIGDAVREELERANGDMETATAALIKRAIPDGMKLFDATRVAGRYEFTLFPDFPDILQKPSKQQADQIWEARPNWSNPRFSRRRPGDVQVTALDMNAAYLSAMKCWLPIGKLTWSDSGLHDKKRSGVYRITPPEWQHSDIPNPLGSRDEPGPLWVTDATLRLLLRASGPKYNLCDAPVIHESWTSGATENILDKMRRILVEARASAIHEGDDVTLEYVKSMYSKLVSTFGESAANRDIRRPDWVHQIRAQAFANLWGKAFKARAAGLTVVRMMGTDELHVTGGDWREVFAEGRGVAEVKIKDHYTIGEVA